MTIKGCNASICVKKVFYPIAEDCNVPRLIELTLDFDGQRQILCVPPQEYTAKGLFKRCPLLRVSNKRGFDDVLINNLMEGLSTGEIQRGLYFENSGANTLPDGSICFVHGQEVIGPLSSPYAVSDEIRRTNLIGKDTSISPLPSLLLASPPQVLLVLAYVLQSSIRSLLIQNGINLQSVLYILGGQGLGKTTLATRISGIYKEGEKATGFIQLGSTSAATNDLLTSLRDQAVIVDDLCLSASQCEMKERLRLAAKLLRQATSDIPIIKKQGNRTVKLPCAASLIITAEFSLDNMSDLTRCVLVPIQAPLDLSDALTPELMGAAVRHYLKWLAKHFSSELDKIRHDMNDTQTSDFHGTRMATNYGCLRAVFLSFLRSLHTIELPSQAKDKIAQRMDTALNKAIHVHHDLIGQLMERIPVGNLPFCILEGYRHGAFDLANKIKKLGDHDGILYKDDLCLRSDALIQFIRQQPGYRDWSRNRITRELKDINALVIQEEKTDTVHLTKESPRVYRIRLNILKNAAKNFKEETIHGN